MRGFLAALPILVLPVTAQAVGLTVLSPTAGTCVNNGPDAFIGGILGGQAAAPVRPLAVAVRLTDNNNNGQVDPITVEVDLGGQRIAEQTFFPAAAGVAFDPDPIAILGVEDGRNRQLTVRARIGDETLERQVAFDLDREAPAVRKLRETPDPLICRQDPPNLQRDLDFEVEDQFDANPSVVERFETEGCGVREVIAVADACGNRQEVSSPSRTFPPPNSISVVFGGIAEGARVGSGSLTFDITAPLNCVDTVTSELRRNGEVIGPVVHGDLLTEPGDYQASLSIASCGGAPTTINRRFTILNKPTANAGGPYEVVQGDTVRVCGDRSTAPPEIGGIIGYAWDINGDGYYDEFEGRTSCIDFGAGRNDGVYPVGLRVEAGNHTFAEARTEVTITDVTPTCDLEIPGGPFAEGEPVELDATGSASSLEEEPILLYEWRFGDGSPDQLAAGLGRTLHQYGEPGEFEVEVLVHDIDSSCSATGTVRITDVRPIIHEVAALGADNLVEGGFVTFTVAAEPGSMSDPILNYTWNFGDGTPPESGPFLVAPVHTFNEDGDFTVQVTVDDEDSQVTEEIEIHVGDLSPVAVLNGPGVAVEGETVRFDADGTRAGGDADPLDGLTWDFGDESPAVEGPADVLTQEHLFADDGTFEITLTAQDEDSTAEATHRITILDVSPVAAFEPVFAEEEVAGHEGVELQFDGSASTPGAAQDPISSWRWDFGDGEVVEGAEFETVRHAFPNDGTYNVRLTVVDEDGSEATSELRVDILNVAPTVRIELTDEELEIGLPYTFTAVIDDVPADQHAIHWDMGDNTTYEDLTEVTHTYAVQGRRVVRVSVDDGDGGTAEAEIAVDITRARPRIHAEDRYDGVEGVPMAIEFRVEAIEVEPGVYDGPLHVPQPQLPPGARWEVVNGNPPERFKTIRITWSPSFVDSGETSVVVRAEAPSALNRTKEIRLVVDEAGTPFATAASLVNGQGRLTVARYGRDPLTHALTFEPRAEIPLGNGAGGLAASDDGRYAFAAVPGSNGVAVIDMHADPPVFARLIPAGRDCAAVAAAGNRLYAVNASDNTITVADLDTLKVVRTAPLPNVTRPVDIAWLPAGAGGLEAARLVVIGARGGQVSLLDPAALDRGANAVVAEKRLGGVLQRVVADPETGWVHVADAKTRRLYAFDAAELEASPANVQVTGTPLDFAAQDLAVAGDTLWVASTGGLVEVVGDSAPVVHEDELSRTVAVVAPDQFPGGGVLLLGGQGLEHRDSDDLNLVIRAAARQTTWRVNAFVTLPPR